MIKNMGNKIVEIIGWLGTIAILVAYGLLSLNVFSSTSLVYQLMNLFGAIAIIYHSLTKKDYQPVFLNFVWGLIALFVIVKLLI